MSNLFAGTFQAVAVNPQIGEYKGKRKTTIEFEIADGDRKGQRVSYDGKLDSDNIRWTKRAMMAVGWQGKDVSTFRSDVLAAKRVVTITTRVAEYTRNDGTVSQWTAVDKVGDGVIELAPLDADKQRELNRYFADVQEAASGSNDSDIPF